MGLSGSVEEPVPSSGEELPVGQEKDREKGRFLQDARGEGLQGEWVVGSDLQRSLGSGQLRSLKGSEVQYPISPLFYGCSTLDELQVAIRCRMESPTPMGSCFRLSPTAPLM